MSDTQTVSSDPRAVLSERVGPIGLVAVNNPPVNAASHAVRAGLVAAVEAHDADGDVEVIVIYGEGRTFIAGADIREFGKPPVAPLLTEVCDRIEKVATPVVAAIHGTTLGGGLEVALSAHARVAAEGTTLGFPEVTLGIIPGAGGTQRSPRLAGMETALDLVTSGKRISAAAALSLGLIDSVVPPADPRELALAAAREILAGTLTPRKTADLDVSEDKDALDKIRQALKSKSPHLFAPQKAVDAVAASVNPIAKGSARERELFAECLANPQRAALVHAFFAERAVAKIPEASATPRPVNRIGVIGGGTMGSGIATAALLAGIPVTLTERDEGALARGRSTVEKNLEGAVSRGKLSEAAHAEAVNSFATTLDFEALAEVDVVIEAAFEDMGVKKEIFAALDKTAKQGAVLATNTSYLDVDEIAASTARPQDVIGLHFFSPAHIMRLLEVVVGKKTAPEVVATGFALAKQLRKVAVRAGVCDGFIGNRILSHTRKAAEYLMIDGASPAEIDTALEEFGFAMGPYAVFDLAGLDISWANRKRLAPTRPAEERYVAVADRLCENGAFGRKTGSGFYVYGDGPRTVNETMLTLLAAERDAAGITPRQFGPDEIVARYMAAMISEAARIVGEGIALRPVDVDAVLLFGYGFPRFRGGPLHYADEVGPTALKREIERYSREDPYFWQVPDLIDRLATSGGKFADLNAEA
ncbi:MAG: 3-hydroxyacyl-CoA dehydrogenase NAD-binding domain-containing protein [Pseudomonadota bacterium]